MGRKEVRAEQPGDLPTETVQIVEKDRAQTRSAGRATLAALAAGTAAMAIDETGYWAAIAAAMAAAAAVYGVPTGAAETQAPEGEVEHLRRENGHGKV